ncbi:MAG: hypothetical protein J6S67_18900 [Methanobrevibacter sp.]|nr:hypothetical protein [Methanobrevibacter sp.]
MKQEEILKALIKELFALEAMHQEYQDNDTHFIVDSNKEGDTLTVKITLKENKDKQEFEKWLENVDNDLFQEVLESFGDAFDMEKEYNSPNYKKVIYEVKSRAKDMAAKKIKELQRVLGQ